MLIIEFPITSKIKKGITVCISNLKEFFRRSGGNDPADKLAKEESKGNLFESFLIIMTSKISSKKIDNTSAAIIYGL
jgi:hypothetical protein